jgi:hypothetical protein
MPQCCGRTGTGGRAGFSYFNINESLRSEAHYCYSLYLSNADCCFDCNGNYRYHSTFNYTCTNNTYTDRDTSTDMDINTGHGA